MASPRRDTETQRRGEPNDRERERDGRNEKQSVSTVQEADDRIGPYRIREEVGRGSFATVFRGTHLVSTTSRSNHFYEGFVVRR